MAGISKALYERFGGKGGTVYDAGKHSGGSSGVLIRISGAEGRLD